MLTWWHALRRRFGYHVPEDGERLLARARYERIDDERGAIVFDRMLTSDEIQAIRVAWERRYTRVP